MPTPDRLADLHRQRATLQAQLAAVEAEIAGLSVAQSESTVPSATTASPTSPASAEFPARPSASAPSVPPPPPPPAPPAAPKPPAPPTPSAEEILATFRAEAAARPKESTRLGCLFYLAAAMTLFALIAGLWFYLKHPH